MRRTPVSPRDRAIERILSVNRTDADSDRDPLGNLPGFSLVVAALLMASASWALWQPDQDVRTELNRWFLTALGP
jgi:hypothetical protein